MSNITLPGNIWYITSRHDTVLTRFHSQIQMFASLCIYYSQICILIEAMWNAESGVSIYTDARLAFWVVMHLYVLEKGSKSPQKTSIWVVLHTIDGFNGLSCWISPWTPLEISRRFSEHRLHQLLLNAIAHTSARPVLYWATAIKINGNVYGWLYREKEKKKQTSKPDIIERTSGCQSLR